MKYELKNGNNCLIRKTKCRHYEMALTLDGIHPATAWKRTNKKQLKMLVKEF